MGAPGLLTKWTLGAVRVSPICHSWSLSSHTYVLLKSGTWGRVPAYHAPEDFSWQTEVTPTTSLMWVNSESRDTLGRRGHNSSRWQNGTGLKEKIHSVGQPFLFALNFSMKLGKRSRRQTWRKETIKIFKMTVRLLLINNNS